MSVVLLALPLTYSTAADGADYSGTWTFTRVSNQGPCNKDATFNLFAKKRKIYGEVESNVGRMKLSGKIVPDGDTIVKMRGSRGMKMTGQFTESSASGVWKTN